MNYECIVKRGFDDYYLEFLDGKTIALSSIVSNFNLENGSKIENDRFIMYSINGIDNLGNNCKYNLRVKKDHIQAYESFIEDFDARCKSHSKIKNINWKRLAVIGLSIVLAASTPSMIKSVKDALDEEHEDWKVRNSAPDYAYENPNLNPELEEYNQYVKKIQKEELDSEKYHLLFLEASSGNILALKDLKEAALSGNEVAQQELANYLFENSDEIGKHSHK